jgi:hypothetical protein
MDNQEKIENLVDELYVLHKDVGERMVELTKENKKVLNEMYNIQQDMKKFVKKEVAGVRNSNTIFVYIIFGSFIIVMAGFIYSMWSMNDGVEYHREFMAKQNRGLYQLAEKMDTTIKNFYTEQKKFIKENQCKEGMVKKNTEANKKSKGR